MGRLRRAIFGDRVEAAEEHARIHARFDALVQNVPLLYLVALSNFAGMYLTASEDVSAWSPAIAALGLLVVVRLAHWIRLRRQPQPFTAKRRALRQTLVFAVIISIGFSIWAQYLLATRPELSLAVAFFGGLTAIGCAYALTGFTTAAAIPLLLLGGPLAIRLVFTTDHTLNLIGVCILLVSLLIGRISLIHSHTTHGMVATQLALEREQRNLIRSERLAGETARKDALTGLANRRAFVEELDAWAEGRRKGARFALALLDLDDFKPVNDVFGHAAGDALLAGIAHNLAEILPNGALLARMGGDEFAILVPHGSEAPGLRRLAKRLCSAARKPVQFRGQSLSVGASCGIVAVDDPTEAGDALGRADRALYAAKEVGTHSYKIFDEELEQAEARHNAIERLLMSGRIAERVTVVYQPIISLRDSGKIVAIEALARWNDEVLGDVSPSEFIPIAERIGAITKISEACFLQACTAVVSVPDVVLSFNVSAVQLCEPDCSDRLLEIMRATNISSDRVQFEVTETGLLSDLTIARRNLQTFQEAGARVALDDFGAGNASLTYLREMRFDIVKLDGSLVRNVAASQHCRMLFKATIDLCHTMGMRCVAEIVETADQLMIVRASQCDGVQGNFICEPLSFESLALKCSEFGGGFDLTFLDGNHGKRQFGAARAESGR